MGLDVSHGCWSGAYSAFYRWRIELAKVAGLPPLELMEGFYQPGGYADPIHFAQKFTRNKDSFADLQSQLPIKWDCLKPDPIHKLLYHSDCDGIIKHKDCLPMAKSLETLLPLLPDGEGGGHIGFWKDKTQDFIDGLKLAHEQKVDVEFH